MRLTRQFTSSRQVHRRLAAAAIVTSIFGPSLAWACTTMALGPVEHTLVAYSYDLEWSGDGVLMVNPTGAERSSIMESPQAEWTVRFASVTFNQFGLGMPTAGMNTEGLIVTLMWNDDVSYPEADGQARLNELELIQYMLDTAATVEEALDAVQMIHLDGMVPIHYFLVDAHGDAATLAYLDGEPAISRGDGLPIRALTNDTYDELLDGVARFVPFAGADSSPSTERGSQARFANAAMAARQTHDAVTQAQAFDALADVANDDTRWNIVFDPSARTVSYRTVVSPEIRSLALDEVDLTCRPEPLYLDIDSDSAGSTADLLEPLYQEENSQYVEAAFSMFPAFQRFGPSFGASIAMAQFDAYRCAP